MGFLTRVRQPDLRADSAIQQHVSDFWAGNDLGMNAGFMSQAGVRVNAELALTLSAFWQGLRILSENIASFPCRVHERIPNDGGDRIAMGHPVDDLLFRRPNSFQNSFEYMEMSVAHLVLRGNMYSWIIPGSRGFVDQLVPIHPDAVKVELLPNGELQYRIQTRTGQVRKGAEDIFHVRGLSFNGYEGVSVITYATQDLGGLLAAETFAHNFFRDGATAAVAAIPEASLGPDKMEVVAKSVRTFLTGLKNANSVFVPPEKMTIAPIGFNPEDAQLLATRQVTPQHVGNWLNMHPSLLGDPSTVSYASTKQFRQNLNDLTFRPIVERFEAAIDADLFLNPDRFFCRFDMSELKRGDPAEQATIQHTNVMDGVWTRNEARRRQGMNPLKGLDEPLEPLNMERTSERGGERRVPNESVARITRAHMIALREATVLVRKEVAAATKAAKDYASNAEGWQAWCRTFYADHAGAVAERLQMPLPLAREYAAKQGTQLSEQGIGVCQGWDWDVAPALANLALCGDLDGRAKALGEAA